MPRRSTTAAVFLTGALLPATDVTDVAKADIETLKAVGGLPAHIVGTFSDPVTFIETRSGEFIVLDKRQHTVYAVNAQKTAVRKVLQVGFEEGRVLQPAVLALSPDDIFAVADAPSGNERIQYFNLKGLFLGGFYLKTRLAPYLIVGPLVLNGVGSMSFTGQTFLLNQPDSGAAVLGARRAGRGRPPPRHAQADRSGVRP